MGGVGGNLAAFKRGMEFIRGLHNLRGRHRGCVATIGNFDGVHLGHAAVIRQTQARAAALGVPDTVVLFEPQPQEFFKPQSPLPRLTRLYEKLVAMQALDVSRVVCLKFDDDFAALSPEEFIERVLHQGLGSKGLVVGDDFRFGAGRRGDFAMLQNAGARMGFGVEPMATVSHRGGRVSSTRIRACLAADDMVGAAELLGRPYAMSGRVVHGDKLGRTLGMPTLNLPLRRRVSPLQGIFAVEVRGLGPPARVGVASIGRRPTVNGTDMRLEVHVFDFAGEIYGERVWVEFKHKLRDELKFDTLAELRIQMQRDAEAARAWLKASGT